MEAIFHYSADTGCLLWEGHAEDNPLDTNSPLLPAYSTPKVPPIYGDRECARYLNKDGDPPASHEAGQWVLQPDWRTVDLWCKSNGLPMEITEPNVIPSDIGATEIPYPGQEHIWRDGQWQQDQHLQYELALRAAESELAARQAKVTAEINRIKPAVDGGYAKPEDVELLPKLQRYAYELPDVRSKPGWPEDPEWQAQPAIVI